MLSNSYVERTLVSEILQLLPHIKAALELRVPTSQATLPPHTLQIHTLVFFCCCEKNISHLKEHENNISSSEIQVSECIKKLNTTNHLTS